ncbi:MAG: hypothetical protein J5762_03490 [Clostridia bacterium]|nr:hypothetical protein [Clostridia bacterium]
MKIHNEFIGGNIKVVKREGNDVYLENELRDTEWDWFYWAFCVEGAKGQTLTFHFQPIRLGYWGPAISHDLKSWRWLGGRDGDSFTYTFGEDEDKVYFAHDMLYHPDRFFAFAKEKGLTTEKFCISRKGRSLPCVKLGQGARSVIVAARHHACEATGNYVLEGFLDEYLKAPLADTKILCVPFVDYDGVIEGDQGKARTPHDHNRDYDVNIPSIYPSCAAIRKYADENGCNYAFDFHSPGHFGAVNDNESIVRNSFEKEKRFDAIGKLFEAEMTERSFKYYRKNDFPFMFDWNIPSANFGAYMAKRSENEIAFSLETPYFGSEDNKVSQENIVEVGRCFCRAFKRYVSEYEGKLPI